MVFDPKSDVSDRIEEACQEYADPDSTMTIFDLEERIERAFRMEYTFEDLLSELDAEVSHYMTPDDVHSVAQILGKEVEPGGTVRFDDVFDLQPFDVRVDPWSDDDEGDGPLQINPGDPSEYMVVQGDVEFERLDRVHNRKI